MAWRVHRRMVAALRAGRSEAATVSSCEAYLTGNYGSFLEQHGKARPSWTWLNTLAHADPERLARMAQIGPDSSTAYWAQTPWDHAAALLAFEIMRSIGGDSAKLPAVQQEVLIPLESAWIGSGRSCDSPRSFVRQVIAALQQSRRSTDAPDAPAQHPARPERRTGASHPSGAGGPTGSSGAAPGLSPA